MRIEQLSDDVTLYCGDCRDILPTLGKVDAVVTDPPYGVTDHAWDVVVPADVWMIGKCAIATATEPFATALICNSVLKFKFDLVWVKNCCSNSMNAKKMPLRRHERVLVFGDYDWNPQKRKRTFAEIKQLNAQQRETMQHATPDSVLEFDSVNNRSSNRMGHPSQKPVELMKYIIQSFTSKEVLDPFMGSGTTGVACVQLGRKFIGIELEPRYFDIACKRISDELKRPRLPLDEPKPTPKQVDLF